MPVPGAGTGDREALSPLQRTLIAGLRIYKVAISPWLPSACRFYPSCSEYMRQAIEAHGVMRGLWIGGKRVLRCHPFHPGGVDSIPRKHE